jgi:hypothetical protein
VFEAVGVACEKAQRLDHYQSDARRLGSPRW